MFYRKIITIIQIKKKIPLNKINKIMNKIILNLVKSSLGLVERLQICNKINRINRIQNSRNKKKISIPNSPYMAKEKQKKIIN